MAKLSGNQGPPDALRRLVVFGAPSFLAGACATAGPTGTMRLPGGNGAFVFDRWAGPPLTVFTAAPNGLRRDTPVVIVMHGQGRNASDYRDQWADLAQRHGFLVVCPEFSREKFPRSDDYNLGRRYDASGAALPVDQWSFSAIDPLFDEVRERAGLSATRYAIYGHSAGAQFVHRFLLHVPDTRVRHAVSANAGWYTLPDPAVAHPFGVGGEAIGPDVIRKWLARPMTILLGTADTDTEQSSLNRTPDAMRQGPHRLARGRNFFEVARARAETLDCPLHWRLAYAPNINHDNSRMAPHAVPFLLG